MIFVVLKHSSDADICCICVDKERQGPGVYQEPRCITDDLHEIVSV